MITVEDLLKAYALAYDTWLDPEVERKDPTPEYAELIRQCVSAENKKLRAERDHMWALRDTWQENDAKLRELVAGLYHIRFGTEEESWDAWEDFCPCGICEERHGGEAPCAYTAKDLADECCEPITKEIVIARMRELGVEVN